jgi:hypothetical protein
LFEFFIKVMLNENHQNLSCEFAEELVSYLYDELKGHEKLRFETHLKTCSFCSDEMAGFGVVRNSMTDWRKADFDSLAAPIIEIPYPEKSETVDVTPVSRPWFASIRDLFTLSPAWMTATTALAVLAICVGLGIVLINSVRDGFNEVVQQEKVKPVPSPTTEDKNANVANSEDNQTNPTPPQSPTPNFSGGKSATPPAPSAPAKTTGKPNSAKPQNSDLKKPEAPKNQVNPKSKQEKVPRLIDEEEEDDTLRLSSIFEEIGTDLK